MLRNALISSNSLIAKNQSQLLKVCSITATNQQRDQKTMPVVERANPEKLPASAFGW